MSHLHWLQSSNGGSTRVSRKAPVPPARCHGRAGMVPRSTTGTTESERRQIFGAAPEECRVRTGTSSIHVDLAPLSPIALATAPQLPRRWRQTLGVSLCLSYEPRTGSVILFFLSSSVFAHAVKEHARSEKMFLLDYRLRSIWRCQARAIALKLRGAAQKETETLSRTYLMMRLPCF